MKFGKYLEARQLELPEYNGHFIDYKSLKKLIKQLSVPLQPAARNSPSLLCNLDESVIQQSLQEHKASFFFRLERELEKVNEFYLEKESNLKVKLEILQSRYEDCKKRGKLASKESVSYKHLRDGIKKFERDLAHLEQFMELNRTGFSKVLKKWDKRSHSHTKDFYLATVVSVQPIFTRNEVAGLNDAALAMLMELNEISSDERPLLYSVETTTSLNSGAFTRVVEIDPVLPPPVNSANSSKSGSVSQPRSNLFDIEMEIEGWYLEVLSIGRLKDEQPRYDLLSSFAKHKIQAFVKDYVPQTNVDKNLIIKDALTKIFVLLVGSKIDDASLKVFLESAYPNIDLAYSDEDVVFSRRSIFHEAAICEFYSRAFILREALRQCSESFLQGEILRKLLNAEDIHGRTPLHYASELGKIEFVQCLIESGLLDSVDVLDNTSKTPLVLAVINNHIEITKSLLVDGHANPSPSVDEFTKPQFSPLNVACAHKNYEAAKLILDIGNIDLSAVRDSQGLCPLHIVAKNGGDAKLVELLISRGADPNGVDGFNRWTPVFYAIQEGHANTVEELLRNGARLNISDEDNLSPLFYALWEGHLSVLNMLQKYKNNIHVHSPKFSDTQKSALLADDVLSATDSLNDIPDFTLPPPIIPLRKYGHNFLEKKIFVKLLFRSGTGSIVLNKEDEMVLSSPGRITLTSNVSDLIPRNVILPIEEDDEHVVVFQINDVTNFSIDFEVFPSFGTRLIAKTTAMPTLFTNEMSKPSNGGHVVLPLFDFRLKNVGELILDYKIIFPYNGKPLEITKYETYWKSTSGLDGGKGGHHFVTSSSLCGRYITLFVSPLNDGTIVVSPKKSIAVGDANLILMDLSARQLEQITGNSLNDVPEISDEESLKKIVNSRFLTLSALLEKIPQGIQLEIEVCFPTTCEIESVPLKLSPHVDINDFIDCVLSSLFDHVRKLYNKGSTSSIVFSSCNPQVCSILNWKQPNFPVLFHMNGLEKNGDLFEKETPHHLSYLALDKDKIDYADPCSRCIREVTQFACHNNLLGVTIPLDLLRISEELISEIRCQGLLLIGSTFSSEAIPSDWTEEDINGLRTDTALELKGCIDM